MQALRVSQQLLRPRALLAATRPLLRPADQAHRPPHRLDQQALRIELAAVEDEASLLGQRREQIAPLDPQRIEQARGQQAVKVGGILPH